MAATRPGDGVLDAAPRGRTPEGRAPKMVRGEFKVIGNRAVFGHEPGAVVPMELTEGVAQALMEAGHIEPHVKRAEPEKE